jgi:hypothetical protein
MDSEVLIQKITTLTKQLYPTGRAFRIFNGSWYDRLHKGLAVSEARAFNDAVGFLDSILPDNPNFTADDATDWERRLGLIDGTGVDLDDRKLAIKRKMNYPGTMKPRENWMNLEHQLQAAGFDVWVHENRFYNGTTWVTVEPGDALVNVDYGEHGEYEHGEIELGDDLSYYADFFIFAEHGEIEHGEIEHGGWIFTNKVVNFIEEDKDATFNEGDSLVATVYIGGETFGTIADVPLVRKNEFRQLILKLKEVNVVAYLLVNYT